MKISESFLISEIKNRSEGMNSRLDTAEKRINELEDPAISIIQNKAQREILGKYEQNSSDLWNNVKRSKCVISIS